MLIRNEWLALAPVLAIIAAGAAHAAASASPGSSGKSREDITRCNSAS